MPDGGRVQCKVSPKHPQWHLGGEAGSAQVSPRHSRPANQNDGKRHKDWREPAQKLGPIPAPLRKHTPDSAARIGHVTEIPRNQMQMHVHARLATGFANVHANVVPVG